MDGQRFDEIARLIGTGASRRRVVKGLAASLLGLSGLAGARSALAGGDCQIEGGSCNVEVSCCGDLICMSGSSTCETCREIGESCGGSWECCSGGECSGASETCVAVEEPTCSDLFSDCSELPCCGDAICASNEFGSSICFRPDECPFPGESCAKGYCCSSTCVDNLCTAICIELGGECVTNDDCCENETRGCVFGICTLDECFSEGEACGVGMLCCGSLECVEDVCTAPAPVPDCTVDSDCVIPTAGDFASVICCAGVCRELECCIDDVLGGGNPNDRCGDGEVCFEGVCTPICANDMDCAGDDCCCDDGSCSGECCPQPELCANDMDCAGDDCCCDDGSCSGTCCPETPVKLPNTGVADGDGGLSGLLGAGLVAGAAAALLAGSKLRPTEE